MKLSEKKLQELKENKISIKDLDDRYFIGPETDEDEIESDNILKLLNEDICSFKEIADKLKSIHKLDSLLKNKEFFEELIKDNRLNKEDLRYLLTKTDNDDELHELVDNVRLLKYIVDKGLFKELINKFKSIKNYANDPCLYYLLYDEELFEELIENNSLNKEDTRYLLNRIDKEDELDNLCSNTPLIKYALNEFMLNKEIVDRLTRKIKKIDWYKNTNIHTVFEMIVYYNKNNEEILKLNELNEKVCLLNSFDLNEEQRLELIEVLRNNEQAQNTLIQIVDNNLEDTYDFETLKNLLTKDSEKRKFKLNF